MVNRDGTRLGTVPHIESMIGRNFERSGQKMLARADMETHVDQPVDGEDRLMAVARWSEFPFHPTTNKRAQPRSRLGGRKTLPGGRGRPWRFVIALTLSLIVEAFQATSESESGIALDKSVLNRVKQNGAGPLM